MILTSVKKTGKLVIVDGAWKTGGFSAEIAAIVAEKAFTSLKAPIMRVNLPDAPAPASSTLENAYYPKKEEIIVAVKELMTAS
jgi:pyruvate dehydrogenase E1 component beta subunit